MVGAHHHHGWRRLGARPRHGLRGQERRPHGGVARAGRGGSTTAGGHVRGHSAEPEGATGRAQGRAPAHADLACRASALADQARSNAEARQALADAALAGSRVDQAGTPRPDRPTRRRHSPKPRPKRKPGGRTATRLLGLKPVPPDSYRHRRCRRSPSPPRHCKPRSRSLETAGRGTVRSRTTSQNRRETTPVALPAGLPRPARSGRHVGCLGDGRVRQRRLRSPNL